MAKEPSKEATLKEVLDEVSVGDVGRMAKGWLTLMGCLGVLLAIVFLIGGASDAVGVGTADWGIPNWVWWVLIAWFYTHAATSNTSYHDLSYYFPKQGWLGSLVLAAYFVGFVYLVIWALGLKEGAERAWAAAAWFAYTLPFVAFTAVTSFGYGKVMAKRRRAMKGGDD